MYSTDNEGKSVVAEEKFIRTLKNKICKYMTSISKNVYIDKLDDTVNEYNSTYHRTIKMKPIDVKDNTYINTDKEVNDKDPRFKVGDCVKISKYKNIFAKGYPMDTSSSIRHRFDVEISRGKFVEITSILKGESTWKLWHRFDVEISTWIQLSKSTKYQ